MGENQEHFKMKQDAAQQLESRQETKIVIESDPLYFSILNGSDVEVHMDDNKEDMTSQTDLDWHANMPVVGKNAYIIAKSGKFVDVNAFTPDYDAVTIQIVDAAVLYNCPYIGNSYVLVIQNALHVPSMTNNLIPPFMMRKAGIKVNNTPKIQCNRPTEDDHAIYFKETNLQIPVSLYGVFSYFPTSKPTENELMESDNMYLLMLTNWNTHCDSYSTNENNTTDWEGNIIDRKHGAKFIPAEVEENTAMTASLQISSTEYKGIDNVLATQTPEEEIHPLWQPIQIKWQDY